VKRKPSACHYHLNGNSRAYLAPARLASPEEPGSVAFAQFKLEADMPVTEKHEHALTQKALDTLTTWGKNPNIDGGENIAFSVSRQGAPSDAFLATGDCTPFTPSGKRGTLKGQPAGSTGAPIAFFDNFAGATPTIVQVPCTFAFDLNAGKVTLKGAFPNLSGTLDFTVEFQKKFDGAGGKNILFTSDATSDNAGYVLALQLVAAS
jgi:hypothetical protein